MPLQSGDDGVLRAMGRRYTRATYLRRLELARRLQPDDRRDRRLPGEDERAFAQHARASVERRGIDEGARLPVLAAARDATAGDDTVPPHVKKERSARLRALSHEACLRRWRAKLGARTSCSSTGPGRGYGDDYSPWLVDAPVGELVRVRGAAVTEEGILAA